MPSSASGSTSDVFSPVQNLRVRQNVVCACWFGCVGRNADFMFGSSKAEYRTVIREEIYLVWRPGWSVYASLLADCAMILAPVCSVFHVDTSSEADLVPVRVCVCVCVYG